MADIQHLDAGDIFVARGNVVYLQQKFSKDNPLSRFINNHDMNKWIDGTQYDLNATLRPVPKNVMAEVERLNTQYVNYLNSLLVAKLPTETKVYTPYHTARMQDVVNRFNDNPKQGLWRQMDQDRYDPGKLMRRHKHNPAAMDQHNSQRPHERNLDLTLAMPQEYTQYRSWRKDIGTLRRSGMRYN
jgi:hypothetical protein